MSLKLIKERVYSLDSKGVVRETSRELFELVKRNEFPQFKGVFANLLIAYHRGTIDSEQLVSRAAFEMMEKEG